MRARFIITIIAILILLVAGLGLNYILSLRKVTFNIDSDVTSLTVLGDNEKEITKLDNSGEISLQDGSYSAIPKGDNISSEPIKFTIKGEGKTIEVKPPYTTEHLENLLKDELTAINSAITSKYSIAKDYTMASGTLYNRGEWFGGLLKPSTSGTRDQRDYYRIVLHKKGSGWEVVRRPEYILSSSRYSEVPIDILRKINQLVP